MFFLVEGDLMTRQKIHTVFLPFLMFGTNVSFFRCFLKNGGNLPASFLLAAGIVSIVLSCFFPKARKAVSETGVKLQPLAAVVFTASFILSFLPYSTVWGNLFAISVLNAVCCTMVAGNSNGLRRGTFAGLFCLGAIAGTGIACLNRIGLIYVCFVVSSFLCRPKQEKRSAQDVWKDVAFPLFVLIGSFLLFIIANRSGTFPSVIAESIVMLMTGCLLILPSSSVRLTLMTIVMMIFGSYVFSIQNQASVFNRTGKSFIRAERLF